MYNLVKETERRSSTVSQPQPQPSAHHAAAVAVNPQNDAPPAVNTTMSRTAVPGHNSRNQQPVAPHDQNQRSSNTYPTAAAFAAEAAMKKKLQQHQQQQRGTTHEKGAKHPNGNRPTTTKTRPVVPNPRDPKNHGQPNRTTQDAPQANIMSHSQTRVAVPNHRDLTNELLALERSISSSSSSSSALLLSATTTTSTTTTTRRMNHHHHHHHSKNEDDDDDDTFQTTNPAAPYAVTTTKEYTHPPQPQGNNNHKEEEEEKKKQEYPRAGAAAAGTVTAMKNEETPQGNHKEDEEEDKDKGFNSKRSLASSHGIKEEDEEENKDASSKRSLASYGTKEEQVDDYDEELGVGGGMSSPSPSPSPTVIRQEMTPDGESYMVTNVVATAVPNEQDIVMAESVQVEGFFHHKRRAMVLMGLLLVAVVVLAVSMGVALSGGSGSGSGDPLTDTGFVMATSPIDGELRSQFGSSVSVCGDASRMAVASPGTGTVQVFDLPPKEEKEKGQGGNWTRVGQDMTFDISMVQGSSKYVRSPLVVSLSADCQVLAVGLPHHRDDDDDDDNGSEQVRRPGRVELYEYNEFQKIWQPLGVPNSIVGATTGDLAGAAISLSRDGGVIAVGSPGHDKNGPESGQVRVFQLLRRDEAWTMVGQALHGDAEGEACGGSVWLSSQGGSKVLAIGSSTGTGEQATTAARVFKLRTGEWVPQGKSGITPNSEALAGIATSWLVRLSLDGTKLVISNVYLDQQGQVAVVNANTGLYVAAFQYDSVKQDWTQLGNDMHRNVEGAKSGYTISLSEDGTRIGMGDPGTSELGGLSGHAHLYEYQNDQQAWCRLGENIMGSAAGDLTGFDVSLSADGSRIVMGSPANRDSGRERGRIWVWDLKETAMTTSCD